MPRLEQLHHSAHQVRQGADQGASPGSLPRAGRQALPTGFTAVDVGGNWLRFHAIGASENEAPRTGLGRVIDVAARQGDARGDDIRAIAVLDAGLLRNSHATVAERDEALAYRAELEERAAPD